MTTITTPKGIGTGHPLTDIQENNLRLKNLERQQFIANIRGYLWLLLAILLLIYIKWFNVLNNIVRECV